MTEDRKYKHCCFEGVQLFISFSIRIAVTVYTVLKINPDLAISSRSHAQGLEIAENQQNDAVLHEYQKTLGKLIEKYGPQLNQSSSVYLITRLATLSALNQLDPDRRSFVIRLLYEQKCFKYQLNKAASLKGSVLPNGTVIN